MKGEGPPQRVSSSPCPGEELPLWSKIIPACPIPLGRLKLIRLKDALHIENPPNPLTRKGGTGIILIGQDLNGQPINQY